MQTRLTVVHELRKLRDVADLLALTGVSGSAVVDSYDRPVGVLTLADIVGYICGLPPDNPSRKSFELGYPMGPDVSWLKRFVDNQTVQQVMSRPVLSVDEEMPLTEVIDLMVNTDRHQVFVTRQHKLVGVISSLDLLRLLRGFVASKSAPA